ncbi:MAG: hypothetical protein ACYTG7_18695 [Planctomycetota bacterium]|jgi:hypothetical protein
METKPALFRATVVFLLLSAGTLWADTPQVEPGVKIKDGTNDLKVDLMSAPTCVDWNNDGAKDLVVGQEIYGNIWLFLNQGTDLNPVFNGGSRLKSDGKFITMSYS